MRAPHLSAPLRRLRLTIFESYQTLVYWGPKLGRCQSEIKKTKERIDQMDEAHPHWANPNMDEVATHIKVLLMLPIAAAIDALFLSPTADYAARVFFPNQPIFATVSRIVVPIFMVWIEATLGVLIHNAEETPKWDGSNREYRILKIIGYGFVLVTPLLVIATFFAARAAGEGDFPLLAFVFALFAAVLHLAILKSGRWIRDAFGWLAFIIKRKYLCYCEEKAQQKHDEAAESVLTAYPVFQTSCNQYMKSLPEDASVIRRLPEGIDKAVRLLFHEEDEHQLSPSLDDDSDDRRITQESPDFPRIREEFKS